MSGINYILCFIVILLCWTYTQQVDVIDLNTDLCQRIQCFPRTEKCEGELVPKGTVFGCCEECVRLIDDGEDCLNIFKPPGGQPIAKCKEGSECNDEGKCKLVKEPACTKLLEHRKTVIENALENVPEQLQAFINENTTTMNPDIWKPECDSRGLFKNKQCKEKRCFCVDESGHRLYGQAPRHLAENMTCACSLAVRKRETSEDSAQFMTKPHERCTPTGDYEELQCVDEVCYCADTTTGKPIGQMVGIHLIQLLPCYKREEDKDSYLTSCEEQAIMQKKPNYEFSRKGIQIFGFTTLNCDYDGTFSPRQCDTVVCHCTNHKGVSMKSYQYDRIGDETQMTCRCARDENENENYQGRYSHWKCEGMGNFYPYQCQAKDCVCVDEDGDLLTVPVTLPDSRYFNAWCMSLAAMFNMETMLRFGPDGPPSFIVVTSE